MRKEMKYSWPVSFEEESDLYVSTGRLVDYLTHWKPVNNSGLFDSMYELHRDMVSGGFWEAKEAEFTKAWILDLLDISYTLQ